MSYWDYKFYIIYLVSLNCGKKYIKGEETKSSETRKMLNKEKKIMKTNENQDGREALF